MKTIAEKIETSTIKSIPNAEYIDIVLHSQKQCEEARANGFDILCRDYADYQILYQSKMV